MTGNCLPPLRPVRTVPPAEPPVSLERIRAQLNIDASDTDVLLREYIDAATEFFDGSSGCLGLVLMTQTWRQDYPSFSTPILLPLRPVQSVEEITYYDADEAQQTLDENIYSLVANHRDGPRIEISDGQSWPSTATRDDAVSVTFVAGHAASAVPRRVQQAIRLIVGDWFRARENSQEVNLTEMPNAALRLIANLRPGVV